MSSAISQLCAVIIRERYGNTPLAIVGALAKGPLPLPVIAKELAPNFRLRKIKRALATLVHFGYVSFKLDGVRAMYQLESSMILNCLKIPRVCANLFGSYGPSADALFLEFMMFGKQPYSRAVREASKGAVEELSNIRAIFHSLVDTHLLQRCPAVVLEAHDCPVFEENYDRRSLPDIFFGDEVTKYLEQGGKCEPLDGVPRKRKFDDRKEEAPDAGILWSIDWVRVDRLLRDYLVREAIAMCNIVDPVCKNTAFSFIHLCQTRCEIHALSSAATAVADIVRATKENNPTLEKHTIERALRILHEDSQGIIRRTGDSAGGLYVLDYDKAITLLCEVQIESYIREKLGTRAVRIFKLLLQKGFLEEEQIEKFVMMSAKETRELTYALVDASFVSIRHISKTNDFAPARTFYLYHVNMPNVVSHMLNATAKSIYNIVVRRLHEDKRYAGLLEQKLKLDEVLKKIAESENLTADEKTEQEEDVKDTYMSNEDRAFLEKYEGAVKKASLIEVLQADTFMMFEQYLTYCKLRC
ncbi:hypothetical protein QR680_017435 [Steinernema hermaphroditum]|uniref:DNA-directed RNA polymerase III subunit RPC3 n=1 Tax=Steinernema hermaphroditum TaxID=289476 RepID=A0AA39LPC8_9BILA|nr:hypothetical protein QR680_017435 [Steinernema hermaphroditum]